MDSIEELVINCTENESTNNDAGLLWPFSNLMNNGTNDSAKSKKSESEPKKEAPRKKKSFGSNHTNRNKANTDSIVPIVDDKVVVDRFQHDVEQAKLMRRNMDKRKEQQQYREDVSTTNKVVTALDVRMGLEGLDQASVLVRNGRIREAFKVSELSIELLINYLKSDPHDREAVGRRVQNALTAAEEMKVMINNGEAESENTQQRSNNENKSNTIQHQQQQQQRRKQNQLNSKESSSQLSSSISASQRYQNKKKNNNNKCKNRKSATMSNKSTSIHRISGAQAYNNNLSKTKGSSKTSVVVASAHLVNSKDPLVQTIKAELYIDQSQLQSTTWNDIAGLNDAKQALQEAAILPLMRPDLFSGLRRPRNILLYGPPGTGKTMLVKAVSHESSCVLFVCTASALTSKWHGEGEKLLKTLFQVARAAAPSIIFVDEMDALLSSRKSDGEHEASRRFKTEFMTNLDGIVKNGGDIGEENDENRKHLLVISATNCPWDIDSAVLRRFPRRIYIPLPDAHTRKALLNKLLEVAGENLLTIDDIKVIIKRLDGFSGSDIASIASEASFGPIRSLGNIDAIQVAKSSDIRPIQRQDFDVAIDQATKSVSKKFLKQYDQWKEDQAAS